MNSPKTGFAVIYRWRLNPGQEEKFHQAWESVTLAFRENRGALGSRLHQSDEGIWIAYAQWPDRETWERSRELGPLDTAVASRMQEAIAESMPPILLEPVCDHLA